MNEMNEKDTCSISSQNPVDNQAETSAPVGAQPNVSAPKRRLWGVACAPPPPPPPEYLRQPPPVRFVPARPEGWVCRACSRFWEWTYRPPSERELDEPCVKCGEVLDLQERATEVNRLLLAHLANRGPTLLTVPVPTFPTSPTLPARPQRKARAELLSKKEAARRLGVDRATTLEKFIASGQLKTVEIEGRVRIPRAEVERIVTEGISDTTMPQRPRARRAPKAVTSRPSESPGAEIRKLKF